MTLSDLTKIDLQTLQSITGDDIKEFFKSHITISVNIALVGVTILVAIVLLSGQIQHGFKLKKTINDFQEREKAVEKSRMTDEEYKDFMRTVPPSLPTDELRKKLSEMALANDIQILSFLPKEKTEDDLAQIANFEVNILSRNYQNIVRFTESIEKMNFAVRIDKWTGKMEDAEFKGEGIEMMGNPITAVLNLSVVSVKETAEGKNK